MYRNFDNSVLGDQDSLDPELVDAILLFLSNEDFKKKYSNRYAE